MFTIIACITTEHDLSLVVLAGLLCTFGAWVTARLHRHAAARPANQALVWHLMTATTAGVSIWCTHFVAMLGFRPTVPVSFDLSLTAISLGVAILGCTVGILFTSLVRMRFAAPLGGAILGLAVSGMHYAGMIAYRVQGLVFWDTELLIASILIAVVLCALALTFGSRAWRGAEAAMTATLTLGIVSLHFTGMAAFAVAPMDIAGDYVNPEAFKYLALAVAGVAALIVLGGLLSHMIENRLRQQSIAELTAARNAAESASRAKSEFMSVLSHELRTPLTIVLGYAGILANLKQSHIRASGGIIDLQAARMGDQAELYGAKIGVAANNLLTIINDILDYTSIEYDEGKLERSRFAAAILLDEIAEEFRDRATAKSVRIEVEAERFGLFADRARCEQILRNIVGNALKFSHSPVVRITAKRGRAGILLSVEDRGRGIAAEHLERIFEPFQQIEDPDNRAEGGTGLGLAICRKLAIAHGGAISVESAPGAGATFTLTLPPSALDDGTGQMRLAG